MRTFLPPCTHQSALAGGGGTIGSLGYLCDWHRASCSLSRRRISDGPAPTPSPPPPGDCGEIWKREERRGEQRNNSKADSLKFFSLFPYRQDAHWSAGGSWLKGAEKGDSLLVVSDQTHASLFCVCRTSQPSSPAWWVMEERLVPMYVGGGHQHATCRVGLVLMYEFHTCSDVYGTIGAVGMQKTEIYQHFSAPSALVEECLLHNPPSALCQTVHHQTLNVFDSSLTSVVTVT